MPETKPPGAELEPESNLGELAQFHASFAEKTGTFQDTDWSWVSAGKSTITTLLLAPEPGFSALFGGLLGTMSKRQRVIAPTYPAIPDSRALVDGLAAVCRAEGVTKVNLVGIGFGGVLAQLFAKRGAAIVNKVALVNTTTPDLWSSAADRKLYNMSRLSPAWVLRRRAVSQALGFAALPKAERGPWRRLLRECLALRKDKWEVLALRAAGFDAQRRVIENGGWSLPGYEGRIQIIESAKDQRITPAQRMALKEACPSAHVRKIPDAGHWLGCVHHERLIGLVDTFLNDVSIIDRTPSGGR